MPLSSSFLLPQAECQPFRSPVMMMGKFENVAYPFWHALMSKSESNSIRRAGNVGRSPSLNSSKSIFTLTCPNSVMCASEAKETNASFGKVNWGIKIFK